MKQDYGIQPDEHEQFRRTMQDRRTRDRQNVSRGAKPTEDTLSKTIADDITEQARTNTSGLPKKRGQK